MRDVKASKGEVLVRRAHQAQNLEKKEMKGSCPDIGEKKRVAERDFARRTRLLWGEAAKKGGSPPKKGYVLGYGVVESGEKDSSGRDRRGRNAPLSRPNERNIDP